MIQFEIVHLQGRRRGRGTTGVVAGCGRKRFRKCRIVVSSVRLTVKGAKCVVADERSRRIGRWHADGSGVLSW
jgi:hypothetical protein